MMRVAALTDSVLRVWMINNGGLPEFACWVMPAAVRAQHFAVRLMAGGFATVEMCVCIDTASGWMTVEDPVGQVVVADATDPACTDSAALVPNKTLQRTEHSYGTGYKTGGVDHRDYSHVGGNTGAFGFTSAQDPICKPIPVYFVVGGEGDGAAQFDATALTAAFSLPDKLKAATIAAKCQ